ncbi:FecR family protein [Aquimarina sp. 2304DJ70-9]|uniref:FecR family protein n=1 Tax=Aquimarina penaris TaxID=3231044 RepID=UPI003462A281
MKKNTDLDINQILKYLNDEMTKSELVEFENLLKYQKNLDLFKKYSVANHYVQLSKHDFDEQKALSSFNKHTQNTKSSTNTRKNRIQNYLKYAAVFIGILLSSLFFVNNNLFGPDKNITEITLQQGDGSLETIKDDDPFKEIKNENGAVVGIQENNKLVYKNESITNPEEKLVINTLRVPYGKKFQLVLSDGTKVHINAGSTLKFPEKFIPGQVRKVELSGEGYFEVARNEKDPFIVSTNGLNTEVFGTKFNVSSYPDDTFSEVVLIEGSVGVFKEANRFNKDSGLKLQPNQKASLTKSNKNLSMSTVKTDQYVAWVDGILLFKNESFENIMKKLERFYDKKITINYQKIKTEKFTGRFDVESIEDVLTTFSSNTPFNFSLKKSKIIINP